MRTERERRWKEKEGRKGVMDRRGRERGRGDREWEIRGRENWSNLSAPLRHLAHSGQATRLAAAR